MALCRVPADQLWVATTGDLIANGRMGDGQFKTGTGGQFGASDNIRTHICRIVLITPETFRSLKLLPDGSL